MPGHRAPSVLQHENEINVVTMVYVFWRYKYLIAGTALLCALAGTYVALTARHVYRAEVVLTEVSKDGLGGANGLPGSLGGLASLAGINLASGGHAREAQAVLRSRYLTHHFIARNELMDELLQRSENKSMWFAVDLFRSTVLKVREEKNQGTTIVEIRWSDPTMAARWANEYVSLANTILRDRALSQSTQNIKYLQEQIAKTNVVELQRVIYSLVESETKTHMLANVREEYAFTVVDPAVVPESRIWPRRTLMVVTAAFLGVFLGALLALAINFWSAHREVLAGPRRKVCA